jgi:hypothetical protein
MAIYVIAHTMLRREAEDPVPGIIDPQNGL